MQLEIVELRRGEDAIIQLAGELDIATGSQVIDATRRALRHRPARLLVDLSAIDFLDLTGVRALIRCRRMAVAKQSGFLLTAPNPRVLNLLDLTGLRAVFEIVD
jgi:anti-sigma B factor antagonist